MSTCAYNNKFHGSESSTKAYLRTNSIIDRYLNILDLNKFRRENFRLTEYARNIYKVDEGRLFREIPLEDTAGNYHYMAMPNRNAFEAIDRAKGIYYQVGPPDMLPVERSEPMHYSEDSLDSKIKAWLSKVGVDYRTVDSIVDSEGNPINANAKADILQRIVEVAEGKESIRVLSEEACHFLVELLGKDHPLYRRMMKEITEYKIYQEVYDQYHTIYNEDIDKIKKEAVGKLISQYIVAEEFGEEEPAKIKRVQSWFEKVWNYIKAKLGKLRSTDIRDEVFKIAGKIITSQETTGLRDISKVEDDELSLEYYQLDRTAAAKVASTFDMWRENVLKDNKSERYFIKFLNRLAKNRVSDAPKSYYARVYRNPEAEESNINKILAKKGTVLHSYILGEDGIINTLLRGAPPSYPKINKSVIEELKTLKEFDGDTEDFYTLTAGQFAELVHGCKKLLERFQKQQDVINKQTNTSEKFRVYTEQPVYDESRDMAGTMDICVVYSDGSISVYDLKGIRFHSSGNVVGDVDFVKEKAFELQVISGYINSLVNALGVRNFIEMRVIPINMQLKTDKESGFYTVEMGSNRQNSTYKEYLEDLPLRKETTGIEMIDRQLTKMYNLRSNLLKQLENNRKNVSLKAKLERLRSSIRQLQVNHDTRYIYKDVAFIINSFRKKSAVNQVTEHDLLEYRSYLELYEGFFNKAADYEISQEPDASKHDTIKLKYWEINAAIDRTLTDISNKEVALVNTRFNIDVTKETKEVSMLGRIFKQLSDFSRPQFKALFNLVTNNGTYVRTELEKIREDVIVKKRSLEQWAKNNHMSLMSAFGKLYNKSTGRLYSKFSSIYGDEKGIAIKNKNIKWFLDNTNLSKTEEGYTFKTDDDNKRFAAAKAKFFDFIDREYEGETRKGLRDYYKNSWLDKYDVSRGASAIFNKNNWFIRPVDNERFYTEEWKYMNLPENKALLDAYNMLVDYNRYFQDITGVDIDHLFVAEIHKDLRAVISQGGGLHKLSGMRDAMVRTLQVRQFDTVRGNINLETGEVQPNIPLLFIDKMYGKVSSAEEEGIRSDVAKEFEVGSIEYNDEVQRRINKLSREKGIGAKSSDLFSSLITFAEAALSYKVAKDTIDAVGVIKNTFKSEDIGTEITTATGKRVIDKITGWVMIKSGMPHDELEAFNKFVNLYWYGQDLQGKDISWTYGEKVDKQGKVIQEGKVMSGTKLLRLLNRFTSLNALGLSWTLSAANAIQSTRDMYVVASEGLYYDKELLHKASIAVMNREKKVLGLMRLIQPFTHDLTHTMAREMSASWISRNIDEDIFYIGMRKPDQLIDTINAIAILKNFGIDKDGRLRRIDKLRKDNPEAKTIYDAIEIKDDKIYLKGFTDNNSVITDARNMIQHVASSIKGSIPEENRNLAGTNIFIASLMMFKNWMVPTGRARFKGVEYNEYIDDLDMGRFRAFLGEFTMRGAVSKLDAFIAELDSIRWTIAEVLPFFKLNRYNNPSERQMAVARAFFEKFLRENEEYRGKVTLEQFIELRKRKLYGMAMELRSYIGFLGVMLAARNLLPPDDEDKVGAWLAENAYRACNKGLLEISFFLNPKSFTQILQMQSLAAFLKTFETLRKALVNTVDTARDIAMGENYKGTFVWKKDKRDRTPAFHYTSKLVPGNRVVTDLFELFGNTRPKSMYSVVP